MNIANKLTVFRVILIPFFLVFLLTEFLEPYNKIIALIIFIVASFTDYLDGYLARSRNLVTNFGKFMDPLADKLLVASALIAFVQLGILPAWIVVIIISREFIISGFRLVAASGGLVIAANYLGKLKTVFQMAMIIVLIPNFQQDFMYYVEQILIYGAVILTVISLIDYVIKNHHVFSEGSKKL
ncbi:MAG: CDP-diacylglycerol--glycerol-3-phosphate 3-phosphatidyltransferase [Eubacteriales bacterium]